MLSLFLLAAGWATADTAKIARGRQVYSTACAPCHGRDGRGNPAWQNPVRPVPFTDCATTAEPSDLWESVVKKGGASAGLAWVMPAFEEAFGDEDISAVVAYIRTFCPEADRYPPGDLNFRRLLATGKAFPEAETVVRVSYLPESGASETVIEALYENRRGPRFQYELVLPFRPQASEAAGGTGLGDIEVEGKYVLHFDLRRHEILSGGLGVSLPTGSTEEGLGDGTTVVAPFVRYGKAWGRTFLQSALELKLPADPSKADRELEYAIGFSRALGPPRSAWTPAVELTGAYNFGEKANEYAVWVELSKPLNKLGHVIGAVGAQFPVRPPDATWRLEAYLLWDFGDGPFWIGW